MHCQQTKNLGLTYRLHGHNAMIYHHNGVGMLPQPTFVRTSSDFLSTDATAPVIVTYWTVVKSGQTLQHANLSSVSYTYLQLTLHDWFLSMKLQCLELMLSKACCIYEVKCTVHHWHDDGLKLQNPSQWWHLSTDVQYYFCKIVTLFSTWYMQQQGNNGSPLFTGSVK